MTQVTGALPAVAAPLSAMLYSQSSHGTTSSSTNIQNRVTVTMLGHALQTVNARMLGSHAMTRTNDSVIQSLSQCIQQLQSSNVKMVLHQRNGDLETQAQNLASVYQKQETKSSDVAIVTYAEHKAPKCKKKCWRKSAKKACLASSASSSFSSGAETSDSDKDTEVLLSTSSQSRCGAPKSGRLVPLFTARKESWTV